jgi:hypothetical protein
MSREGLIIEAAISSMEITAPEFLLDVDHSALEFQDSAV